MGFFEKVKNMFTEEVEDDDVKVEQIKKEVTHVSIDSPVTKKEESDFSESNFEFKVEEKSNKPVFFDDNDFRDLNLGVKEPEEKPKIVEKELYNNKAFSEKKVEEKKVFKPTPIISPVYGVLDKNYHKEDIVSKTNYNGTTETSADSIDSIRNKAYGTLEDELENTLFGRNSILFKKDNDDEETQITEVSDDVLTSLTDDISKELDELLIKKEKYNDDEIKHGIKNDDNLNEDDLLDFIDSTLYKEGDDI